MRICAFLHPDAIPEEIITEGATHLGPDLQAAASNPLAFNQAISVLLSYSLLKRNADDHLLSIHRLVQAVLKDGMDVSSYHRWAERTVEAVDAALSEVDYWTTARYERCLPHAQECSLLIEQLHLTSPAARRLLNQTGIYLYSRARYAEAEAVLEEGLHIREQALGPSHPAVAGTLNGLANLYKDQGNYVEAASLYQRAMCVWEQAWGSDHPLTRRIAHDYATLLRKIGREAEAQQLEARFPSTTSAVHAEPTQSRPAPRKRRRGSKK